MSAFLPESVHGHPPEPEHPRLQQRPVSPAEQKARWEVRAAEWRAREVAEVVFGRVSSALLTGLRAKGPLRGLLRLDVPFDDLDAHRVREHRFLTAVETDPVLSRIRLVYVIGPESS